MCIRDSYPILEKFIELPFKGDQTPFSAEVWYINKQVVLDAPWGTPSPIQIMDAKLGIMVPVQARGQFGVQISDARAFLIKLVATMHSYSLEHLRSAMRGMLLSHFNTLLAEYLVQRGVSVLEIAADTQSLSTQMQQRLAPDFGNYGVGLVDFRIISITVPEDDPAVARVKKALAHKAELDLLGTNLSLIHI